MSFSRIMLLAAVFAALAPTATAQAQQADTIMGRPKMGVGYHISWPAYGLSGIYDVQPTLSLQAVAGFFGSWNSLSGRALYRLPQRPRGDVYGYAAAGAWSYSLLGNRESTINFGGGAGVDVDWRRFLQDLDLPLFTQIEIGLSSLSLPAAGYNGVFMSIGAGLHYRF